MKRLRTIINCMIWTICGLYLTIVVLLNIPIVQSFVGTQTSRALGSLLNTNVSIGRIDLGLLNRITIDNIRIDDQASKKMLYATRLSAKISFSELIQGNITISSAQIFGLQANIYRANEDTSTNLQFLIDALASKDTTKTSKPLNLEIGSLVIRHGMVKYDQLDSPDYKLTSLKHIDISGISSHIVLSKLTNDSINLYVKKLSLADKSGLKLDNIRFRVVANKRGATVDNLEIALPKSQLLIPRLVASYDAINDKAFLPTLQFEAQIGNSHIYLPDLQTLIPSAGNFDKVVSLSSSISGTGTSLKISNISVSTDNGATALDANGGISNGYDNPRWFVNLSQLKIAKQTIADIFSIATKGKPMPLALANLGNMEFVGSLGGNGGNISANGALTSEAGEAKLRGGKDGSHVAISMSTNDCNLAKILDNDKMGLLDTDIKLTATIGKTIDTATATGHIEKLQYNGYTYKNIDIDGKLNGTTIAGLLNINDDNLALTAKGCANTAKPELTIAAQLSNIRPKALNISSKWGNSSFAANINASLCGKDIDSANGNIGISDFSMSGDESSYHIDNINLTSANSQGRHTLTLSSDFANIAMTGNFRIADIIQHAENMVVEKLPSVQQLTNMKARKVADSKMLLCADIFSLEPLRMLLGTPASIQKPIRIDGYINSKLSQISLLASVPDITYNGQQYSNISLNVGSPNDSLVAMIKGQKVLASGKRAEYSVNAKAADNKLTASLDFDNHSKLHLKGSMNANASFSRNKTGEMEAVVNILPSHMLIDNTNWNINNSTISYSPKNINIHNFAIEHGDQHIHINGKATAHSADSVTVDLKEVDVAYILNLVNFHSVEFDGKATGKAYISGIFGTPRANAKLAVENFLFEKGRMGTLYADVAWDNEEGKIDINATAKDDDGRHTDIAGYVSPKQNYIDLGISAHNTRAEFMQSFCGSFMDRCNASANGNVRLWGPLDGIELTGALDVNGSIHLSSINTEYTISNGHVELKEGEIVLSGDTIIDRNGNTGVISGSLYHKHLSKLTYDLGIYANNLLVYDFDGSDGSSFYGTAYGTGQCNIRGRSGEVVMDIDITPNAGTIATYNASSPDAIKSQDFIHWADRDSLVYHTTKGHKQNGDDDEDVDIPSDIRLNFLIHTQPTATLRLLMDQSSGDYIDLRGTGVIRATYYNKGSFDLYGNYNVESGVYKLTVQNALHKDFEFLPGGTIAFGGNPYDAILNLKAMHTVNSVSLSDLQLGRSFTSNNIRVNCLMDITGTPNQPKVDFGLDMPTVSNDAKQMIYSLINSEEEMNQQVIYLLAVGRFYSQGNNNANADGTETQSQTALAMQSILSGQISQQINSLLGSVINSNNWNFGANISTGDEGWNNAEYEGLLSGRLLNNRLLINGQFGYRDNANATTSFIGDFDIRYLLYPNGNLAVRVYNQSNDRYFTRNSLNTQGLGFILKKDFNGWLKKPSYKTATNMADSIAPKNAKRQQHPKNNANKQ